MRPFVILLVDADYFAAASFAGDATARRFSISGATVAPAMRVPSSKNTTGTPRNPLSHTPVSQKCYSFQQRVSSTNTMVDP